MRHALGEQRVVTHVLLAERLLDQQQVEGVELRQVFGIGERVGGVRVDLKGNVGVGLSHGTHGLDVPTGLDLELDALVALVEVAVHGVEQLRGSSPECPRTPRRARGPA